MFAFFFFFGGVDLAFHPLQREEGGGSFRFFKLIHLRTVLFLLLFLYLCLPLPLLLMFSLSKIRLSVGTVLLVTTREDALQIQHMWPQVGSGGTRNPRCWVTALSGGRFAEPLGV